jgi:hypothetical protein
MPVLIGRRALVRRTERILLRRYSLESMALCVDEPLWRRLLAGRTLRRMPCGDGENALRFLLDLTEELEGCIPVLYVDASYYPVLMERYRAELEPYYAVVELPDTDEDDALLRALAGAFPFREDAECC